MLQYAYFNNFNSWLFPKTRPIEAIFRDPWWVASCGKFLWVLKSHYDLTLREVVTISPRFGVMLGAMVLSISFVILDILSATDVLSDALPVGVNPFWKLALVFKCLTDTVILDDFKTALDKLWTFRRASLANGEPLEAGPYARVRHSSVEAGSSEGQKRSASREHAAHVLILSLPRHHLMELGQVEMQPPLPSTART